MAIPELAVLRKAVKGLLFMSEIDAPFKAIALHPGESPTKDNVAEILHAPADSVVEEVPFTKFFADLTKAHKWHAEDDKAVVKRYQTLLGVLRDTLTSLKVFKIGRVRVKIAILGKAEGGLWAGLLTDALET